MPDSPSTTALASTYKIAPMDTLAIKVFGLEKISGDYQVDLLGNVAMPLIGDVAAADLTPSQFDDLLTQEYSQKYLENPDISVGIKASAGRIVTVDGSVQRAGSFPVGGPMTLMQAVALAGGVDDRANAHRVAIFRTIDGKRQAAAFDLVSIRHGEMQDPPVYAGDIVVVDGSSIKDAQRKIFQSFPLLTVFRPFIL
ncbi:MAG TPA: polysaccharide biosynthesis/export family protein [Sphingomicrobium sp.]|nr:polysaccharide biosynthesis/export family protein [Sphingomicrobium sp.]